MPLRSSSVETTNNVRALSAPVTITVELSHGRVMVPAKINGSKPLSFLLDTGYGITMVHPDLIESLGLKRAGRLTIVGIAGEEEAGTYENAVFDLGGVTYAPRRVASLPSEAEHRRRRDGILGAGFFRRFIVEIDCAKKTMRLHEPSSFEYKGKGEIIPLEFERDTPIIEAVITATNGAPISGRFEIDTGCDDALCLGREFVEANRLAPTNKLATGEKRGVGGGAQIQHGSVPQLKLGRLKIEIPSANFFMEGSPAGKGLAGHIGMAALGRYKVIFDYSRQRMILEENH
jgi:predicted aspartyl protease